MWLALSFLALFMLSIRRSAEKQAGGSIDSMAMVWLQQAVAFPLIIASLFFAKFYWPGDLTVQFWVLLAGYVVVSSVDLFCYFKALTIADISYVAPLMSLFAVGNIAGAFVILHQVPTPLGVLGACLIIAGAYLNTLAKKRQKANTHHNQLALLLVITSVVLRSVYANIEVIMLRLSNPTSYNFYSSLVTIPFVILITIIVLRQRRIQGSEYWGNVLAGTRQHYIPLAFVGVTYTINMLATFYAKLVAPNAAYVGAIKSAAVLPVVLIGVIFFKETIVKLQWQGIALIVLGLLLVGTQ